MCANLPKLLAFHVQRGMGRSRRTIGHAGGWHPNSRIVGLGFVFGRYKIEQKVWQSCRFQLMPIYRIIWLAAILRAKMLISSKKLK
jgi:hypothetical protein